MPRGGDQKSGRFSDRMKITIESGDEERTKGNSSFFSAVIALSADRALRIRRSGEEAPAAGPPLRRAERRDPVERLSGPKTCWQKARPVACNQQESFTLSQSFSRRRSMRRAPQIGARSPQFATRT